MRNFSKIVLLAAIVSFLTTSAFANGQRKFGVGLDGGFQRVQGGSPINYFSAVYGIYGVYNLSPKSSIHLRASYGKLESNNHGYFWSSLTPVEAFFSYKLGQFFHGKVEPALHFGVAAIRFTNKNYNGAHYYDGAVFPGFNLQYYPMPNVSILFSADLKATSSKSFDNAPNRDLYAVIRGGVTYYWMKSSAKRHFRPKYRRQSTTQVAAKRQSSGKAGVQSTKSNEDAYLKIVELKSTIDNLQQQLKQKDAQIDELKVLLNIKKEKVAVLENKIKELKSSPSAQTPTQYAVRSGRTNAAASGVSAVHFRRTYKEALNDFRARRYTDAIQKFSILVATNPDHPLASNCHYWIGESYYALKDYAKAKTAFQSVLGYAKTYKKEPALLMLGLSYLRMGDRQKAAEEFRTLSKLSPNSHYGKIARRYLSKLERETIS